MASKVLVLGDDCELADELTEALSRSTTVAWAPTSADTEALGVDCVVLAGTFPLAELFEVRVHPNLHDRPVVLVATDGALALDQEWRFVNVWPVASSRADLTDRLIDQVKNILARALHPSHGRCVDVRAENLSTV